MTKKKILEKSLVDMILEEMYEGIEKKAEFDSETIEKLKRLVATSDLKKASKVMEALKVE